MSRPNKLLIITDLQCFDCLGSAGHLMVKTRHIDALAQRGARFERF